MSEIPWFKVDDSFESHPKVKGLPRTKRARAVGLWTLAGSWSARQLTDGFVPSYMLDELACTAADARALVAVGLWIECEGGYQFKGWQEWQPTRERVESERTAARERMRVARERKKQASSANVRANNSEQEAKFGERSGEVRSTPRSVTPTRPDPTRPIEEVSDGATASPAPTAQTFIAEWLDHSATRPPSDIIGQVSKRLKSLINDGIEPDAIRRGLAEWDRRSLHPSTLPSVVHEMQKATGNVVHLPDGRIKLPPLPKGVFEQ